MEFKVCRFNIIPFALLYLNGSSALTAAALPGITRSSELCITATNRSVVGSTPMCSPKVVIRNFVKGAYRAYLKPFRHSILTWVCFVQQITDKCGFTLIESETYQYIENSEGMPACTQ